MNAVVLTVYFRGSSFISISQLSLKLFYTLDFETNKALNLKEQSRHS